MKPIVARTWVQWYKPGSEQIPKACLIAHVKPEAIKRQFVKMAKIYTGLHGHRTYTESEADGTILFDTNRGDWIPYEVRRVRDNKHPHLLIGRLKTEAGLKALEQKLKGDQA